MANWSPSYITYLVIEREENMCLFLVIPRVVDIIWDLSIRISFLPTERICYLPTFVASRFRCPFAPGYHLLLKGFCFSPFLDR
uniref:Uncharacterized protein n=1 Tax=Picea glauca TaxID=3330 RepID=A0A101M2I8_PICGL|nr:hypothetical protein ABT39_MTgene3068 [Picea glauca]QHR87283.1 hypothetical protein Q903MT_gene1293 [Picea sitchensis]